MSFLRDLDYHSIISEANLNVILKQARGVLGDTDILANLERNNIAQMKNSLRGRFVVDEVFAEFKTWDIATNYYWNDRLDWTATDFALATVYTSGTLLLYEDTVYEKNATTIGYAAGTLPTNATFFTNRGAEGVYYITPPVPWDEFTVYGEDDLVTYKHRYYIGLQATEEGTKPTDTAYWERVTDLSTYNTVGHWPNEDDYWTFGDNREQSVIECLVDLIVYDVHAVINPRNVPMLRSDRYQKATAWLSDIRKGLYDLNLPEIGGQSGFRIRCGSNPQSINYY